MATSRPYNHPHCFIEISGSKSRLLLNQENNREPTCPNVGEDLYGKLFFDCNDAGPSNPPEFIIKTPEACEAEENEAKKARQRSNGLWIRVEKIKVVPKQYEKRYWGYASNLSSFHDQCVFASFQGKTLDVTRAYRFKVAYQLRRDPKNAHRDVVGGPSIQALQPDIPNVFLDCFRKEFEANKSYLQNVQFDLPEVMTAELTMCFGKCLK